MSVASIIPGFRELPKRKPEIELYRPARPTDGLYLDSGLVGQERFINFFSQFRNQIVVEIGPGDDISGAELVRQMRAEAWVGVDPYFADKLKKMVGESLGISTKFKMAISDRDILTFLKGVPKNSVSVYARFIDNLVFEKGYQNDVC